MKKIPILLQRSEDHLGQVVNKINPECEWVYDGSTVYYITQKFDGSSCAIIDGVLYKRYVSRYDGHGPPPNSIPCDHRDPNIGEQPFWTTCDRGNSDDVYHFEAFDKQDSWEDGTYELCGEKVKRNREQVASGHVLIKHGSVVMQCNDLSYIGLKLYLATQDIEGLVIHSLDGRMCKIRQIDFGMQRQHAL